MDEQTLDLLEKRIAALEKQVFGENKKFDPSKEQTVTDLLLQTNTMIASALSCRENIVTTLEKMEQLNEYLDPKYGDGELDANAAKQYVLEMQEEIRQTVANVAKFKELSKCCDEYGYEDLIDVIGKLEPMLLAAYGLEGDARNISQGNWDRLFTYNKCIRNAKEMMTRLAIGVEAIEAKSGVKVNYND